MHSSCQALDGRIERLRPRPEWDMRTLDETGFTDICCDTRISDRIYTEVDETFNPVPMFRLTAGKPG